MSNIDVAQAFAGLRAAFGPAAFGLGGKFYDCGAKNLSLKHGGELVQTGAVNAAFADIHEIALDPSVASNEAFAEGAACTYEGRHYTIASITPPVLIGGQAVSLRIVITRTPPPDSATEAGAGERKAYYPAPSTL